MIIRPRMVSPSILNLKNNPFSFRTRFTSFSFRRPFSPSRKVSKRYNTFVSRMGTSKISFGKIQTPKIHNINV